MEGRPQRRVGFATTTTNEIQWRNLYVHKFGGAVYPPVRPMSKAALREAGLIAPIRSFSPSGRGLDAARGIRRRKVKTPRAAVGRKSATDAAAARRSRSAVFLTDGDGEVAISVVESSGTSSDEDAAANDGVEPIVSFVVPEAKAAGNTATPAGEPGTMKVVKGGGKDGNDQSDDEEDDDAIDNDDEDDTAAMANDPYAQLPSQRGKLPTTLFLSHSSVDRALPDPRTWQDANVFRARYPAFVFDRFLCDGVPMGLQFVAVLKAIQAAYTHARFTEVPETVAAAFMRLITAHPKILNAIAAAAERDAELAASWRDESGDGSNGAVPSTPSARRTDSMRSVDATPESPMDERRRSTWGVVKRIVSTNAYLVAAAGQGGRRQAASGASNMPQVTPPMLPAAAAVVRANGPAAGVVSPRSVRVFEPDMPSPTAMIGAAARKVSIGDIAHAESESDEDDSSLAGSQRPGGKRSGRGQHRTRLDRSTGSGGDGGDDAATAAELDDGTIPGSPSTLKRRGSLFAVDAMPVMSRSGPGASPRAFGMRRASQSDANDGAVVRPDVHLKRALARRAVTSAHEGFVGAVDDVVLYLEARTDRTIELLACVMQQLLDGADVSEHDCDQFLTMYPVPHPYLCLESASASAKMPAAAAAAGPAATAGFQARTTHGRGSASSNGGGLPSDASASFQRHPDDGLQPSPSSHTLHAKPPLTPNAFGNRPQSGLLASGNNHGSHVFDAAAHDAPPAPVAAPSAVPDRDINDIADLPRTVPRIDEPHPLLLPLQLFESYADLHAVGAVSAVLEPVLRALADPETCLYVPEVVRLDLAPPSKDSSGKLKSPPSASSPRRAAAPAGLRNPAPKPPSALRGKSRLRAAANAVRAARTVSSDTASGRARDVNVDVAESARSMLSAVATALVQAATANADASADEAGAWLPAGVQYLGSVLAAIVCDKVLGVVSKSDGGAVGADGKSKSTKTFLEKLGLPDPRAEMRRAMQAEGPGGNAAAKAAEATGSASTQSAYAGSRGDPSMFPQVFFPAADVAERLRQSQNPLVQGLLHARIQRFLVLERLICRYLADPRHFGLLPPDLAATAAHAPLAKHLSRNCRALAYYLQRASSGQPITDLFVVQVDDTPAAWRAAHAPESAAGIPPSLQPLARMPVTPKRTHAVPQELTDHLDYTPRGVVDDASGVTTGGLPSALDIHIQRSRKGNFSPRRWSATRLPSVPSPFSPGLATTAGSGVFDGSLRSTGSFASAGSFRRESSGVATRSLPSWIRGVIASTKGPMADHMTDRAAPPLVSFMLEHFALFAVSPVFALEPREEVPSLAESLAATSFMTPKSALSRRAMATPTSREVGVRAANLQLAQTSAQSKASLSTGGVSGVTTALKNRIVRVAERAKADVAQAKQLKEMQWPREAVCVAGCSFPHSVIAAATGNLLAICKAYRRIFIEALEESAKRVLPLKVEPPQLTQAAAEAIALEGGLSIDGANAAERPLELLAIALRNHGRDAKSIIPTDDSAAASLFGGERSSPRAGSTSRGNSPPAGVDVASSHGHSDGGPDLQEPDDAEAADLQRRRRGKSLFDHAALFGSSQSTRVAAADATAKSFRASQSMRLQTSMGRGFNESSMNLLSGMSTVGLSRSFVAALHEAAAPAKVRAVANASKAIELMQRESHKRAQELAASAQKELDEEFFAERVQLLADRAAMVLDECAEAGQDAFTAKLAEQLVAVGALSPSSGKGRAGRRRTTLM